MYLSGESFAYCSRKSSSGFLGHLATMGCFFVCGIALRLNTAVLRVM